MHSQEAKIVMGDGAPRTKLSGVTRFVSSET